MSQPDYPKYIENFLNDVTTALPYSDYIRSNVGNYVIIENKPYVIKGIKFRHSKDNTTRANGYLIQCFIQVENTRDDAYLAISVDESQVIQFMDRPMILIDLINAHLCQKLKFLAKNKTTDLLFKKEN